jgi:dTDP-4-amino-4,6-dideoxygalactose transaminase
MTVFSFHPVKTMTTGEGGMLLTDNEAYAAKARQLRAHGVMREQFAGLGAPEDPELAERGPWYYEMQALGYNYRITDIQCALGLSQLARLDAFTARRREIVARYNEALAGIPSLTTPGLRNAADREFISWHLYTVQIDFRAIGKTRTQVMAELRAKGVGSQVLYIPVHLQPWYRQTYGYGLGKCPVAETYYRRALSLPLFSAMKDADVGRVIESVKEVIACGPDQA